MNRNLSDGINLASKITPRRLINAFQVWKSYHLSRKSQKAHHQGLPISLSFEPTTHCNLRCPECPSGLRSFTRPTGLLNQELFEKVVDELHETLCYLLLYFQGEPYLHPNFLDLVKYASQRRIYTATSTNAHYLGEENAHNTVVSGLDRLIISIDGTTQDVYESYRKGGQLEKVIEGTKNMVHWKKKLKSRTPHLIFQFLVVKPNEHQIKEVQELAKDLGVDTVAFKTAQIYDYEEGSPLIPTIDRYSRYRQNANGGYELKNGLLNQCWKMWHSAVVTWDGQVVPCCFDKDASHSMGQLGERSFKTIWNSEPYNAFRNSLLRSRDEIEMCKNCTEGTKVWA